MVDKLRDTDGDITGLSNGNNITILNRSRDGVCLNRGRVLVATQVDVLHHDRVEPGGMKLLKSYYMHSLDPTEVIVHR